MYQRPRSPERRPYGTSPPPTSSYSGRATSGNRSGKVIEELQSKLELIHRELVFTKQQLDIARQAKGNAEQTAQELANANAKLRSEMTILLSMTDRKDRQIEEQKQKMAGLDTQLRKQRDESSDAKSQLDKMAAQHESIVRTRDEADEARQLADRQYDTLKASFSSLQDKHSSDIASLKAELASLRELFAQKTAEAVETTTKAEKRIAEIVGSRSEDIEKVEQARRALEENREKLAAEVQKSIGNLRREVEASVKVTEGYEGLVGEAKQEVDALLVKIRNFNNLRPET